MNTCKLHFEIDPKSEFLKRGVTKRMTVVDWAGATGKTFNTANMEMTTDGKPQIALEGGDFKLGQLDPVAEALLKSALGVRGAYTLGSESAFSAENVTLQPGEVDSASDTVNLTVTPKAVNDVKPSAFFINIIAR